MLRTVCAKRIICEKKNLYNNNNMAKKMKSKKKRTHANLCIYYTDWRIRMYHSRMPYAQWHWTSLLNFFNRFDFYRDTYWNNIEKHFCVTLGDTVFFPLHTISVRVCVFEIDFVLDDFWFCSLSLSQSISLIVFQKLSPQTICINHCCRFCFFLPIFVYDFLKESSGARVWFMTFNIIFIMSTSRKNE